MPKKSLNQSIQRFKEKIIESSPIQEKNPENIKESLVYAKKLKDSFSDEESSDSKKLQQNENIYKQRILENMRKNKEKSFEDSKKQDFKAEKPAQKKNFENQIFAENIFKISKKNEESRNPSPHFENGSESNEENVYNTGLIFNDKEKASVMSKISKSTSRENRSVSPDSKIYNNFSPFSEKFEKNSDKIDENPQKNRKKVKDFETQRELLEQEHENYYEQIKEK